MGSVMVAMSVALGVRRKQRKMWKYNIIGLYESQFVEFAQTCLITRQHLQGTVLKYAGLPVVMFNTNVFMLCHEHHILQSEHGMVVLIRHDEEPNTSTGWAKGTA